MSSKRSENSTRAEKAMVLKKKKKVSISKDAVPSGEIDVSEEEKKELDKIESELDIEEQEFTCIVHKGTIKGANIYLCPNCKTFYCVKCATALKERGEKCWLCYHEFEF